MFFLLRHDFYFFPEETVYSVASSLSKFTKLLEGNQDKSSRGGSMMLECASSGHLSKSESGHLVHHRATCTFMGS